MRVALPTVTCIVFSACRLWASGLDSSAVERVDGSPSVLRGTVSDLAIFLSPADEDICREGTSVSVPVVRGIRLPGIPVPSALGEDVCDGDYEEASDGGVRVAELMTGHDGVSSRFAGIDRNDPIEYRVDVDALPAGLTESQALAAVSNALAAWSAVSSVRFVYGGVQSFGVTSHDVADEGGRLWIQLHDLYGYMAGSSSLGRGGRAYRYHTAVVPDGGLGGRVGEDEFDLSVRGYVVLAHTNALLSNPANLEEVLCHEIGHALSMGHSSDNMSETNADLCEATMFCVSHLDGRGACLQAYDEAQIRAIYPLEDTPPYGFDRCLDALTSSSAGPSTGAANRVAIVGGDRQGDSLAVTIVYQSAWNGAFAVDGDSLVYTPAAVWPDSERCDPAGASAWDYCYLRLSDGINASPPFLCRVLSFSLDDDGDGLPDTWASSNGVSGAGLDLDEDGLSNFQEWLLDTDPDDGEEGLSVLSFGSGSLTWRARPYSLYQAECATQPAGPFVPCAEPSVPTGSVGSVSVTEPSASRAFFRISLVP